MHKWIQNARGMFERYDDKLGGRSASLEETTCDPVGRDNGHSGSRLLYEGGYNNEDSASAIVN